MMDRSSICDGGYDRLYDLFYRCRNYAFKSDREIRLSRGVMTTLDLAQKLYEFGTEGWEIWDGPEYGGRRGFSFDSLDELEVKLVAGGC